MRPDDDTFESELSRPPTDEELADACALRDALEGKGDHPDVELCRALRLADAPTELDPQTNEWMVRRAIQRAKPPRSKLVVVASGAAAVLGLAAGVALLVSPGASQDGTTVMAKASLVPSRTTQPLFDAPFDRHGGNSARVDRIARSRGQDYRTNLLHRMGVR
jgi:hypothetical protein